MASNITIESLNCNGLGIKKKRRRIFKHFFKKGVDIILLQETHTTPTTASEYRDEWKRLSRKHDSFWNSLSSTSCGVAILIADQKKKLKFSTPRVHIPSTITSDRCLLYSSWRSFMNANPKHEEFLRPN